MSIQDPLENYGLERIRMEEDDRYVWVYYAGKVENVVNKLTKENEELKAKLESVQATAYAESVDAGMENRRLKRALWMARAERATAKLAYYDVLSRGISSERGEMYDVWNNVERKCRAKAKEYK